MGPRGALINRTFAEMYNLRAIAATLVEMPSGGAGAHDRVRNACPSG